MSTQKEIPLKVIVVDSALVLEEVRGGHDSLYNISQIYNKLIKLEI